MVLAEKEDGGARLDQEEKLSRLFDGEEVGDGLLDAVVEELEVFAVKALDEMAGGVGDGDADIYAADSDADGRRGFLRLSGGHRDCKEQ